MKISKLFHWLYAIVLLLPVFSIGGKMLYVTFNNNAKESYSAPQYDVDESVILNSSDLEMNNWYHFDSTLANITTSRGWFQISEIKNIQGSSIYASNYENMINANQFFLYSNKQIYLNHFDPSTNTSSYEQWYNLGVESLSFDFVIISTPTFSNENYGFCELTIYYQNGLDNAFYYAVNQINEQPIFAWAKDSFLVEPIAYVSELFGLSNTSPLITLLSYWLNMSIIWLCFDIIMYVPLMAHRWLDKGAIE